MKILSLVSAIAIIVFFTACSSGEKGGGKKLVIWANGKIEADATNKTTINFEPSNRHNELEIPLTAEDKKITVKTAGGDKTYDVADEGVFLLNLKADTVIGSIVNFG